MKYKYLGNSKLKVSSICLGTMTFGEQSSTHESYRMMDYAYEKGVNFFDTAEIYPVYPKKYCGQNRGNYWRLVTNKKK